MLLWTWQNKKVSLVKDEKLDNLKYSFYCNKESDCSIEKHREVYKMVFDKLHTDQIIWCFTDSDEAVEDGNIQEFEVILKRILWEIDVSEKEIKWYCPIVWTKLRTGELKMTGFVHKIYMEPLLGFEQCDEKLIKSNFKKDFNKYWSDKNEVQLLDLMFLKNKPIFDVGRPNTLKWSCCSSAIIIHPKESIVKNPLSEDINWWRTLDTYNTSPRPSTLYNNENLLQKIPCENCPGR